MEDVYNNDLQKKLSYNYACLKVINHEYEQISECYAVLRAVYTFMPEFGLVNLTSWIFTNISNKRLRWRNSENCEIKIGPRTGQEILRVYRLAVELGDNSRKVLSDFNICDENYKGSNSGNDNGITDYFFEIEVYGNLKDRDIKPKKFFGLIKVEFTKTDNSTSYSVGIWKINLLELGKLKFIGWISKMKPKKQQIKKLKN